MKISPCVCLSGYHSQCFKMTQKVSSYNFRCIVTKWRDTKTEKRENSNETFFVDFQTLWRIRKRFGINPRKAKNVNFFSASNAAKNRFNQS